eukprot:scaffold72626_cov15-Tisochrysis_lutea.AAC.1
MQPDCSQAGVEAHRVALHRQLCVAPRKSMSFSAHSPLQYVRPFSHDGVQVGGRGVFVPWSGRANSWLGFSSCKGFGSCKGFSPCKRGGCIICYGLQALDWPVLAMKCRNLKRVLPCVHLKLQEAALDLGTPAASSVLAMAQCFAHGE